MRALERFVGASRRAATAAASGTGVPATPLPPRTLRKVAPLRRLRGRVGRTAAAIGVTVDDLAFSLSPAFLAYSGGGLRGGGFAVRRGQVIVRRFSAVRGMWITGVGRGAACCACGSAAAPRRTGGSPCVGRAAQRAPRRAARARAAAGLRRRRASRAAVGRLGRRSGERVPRAFRREVFALASGSVTRALTGSRSVRAARIMGGNLRRDPRGATR